MIRLLAVISLLLCALSPVYAGSVHILLSDSGTLYREAADHLRAELTVAGFSEPVKIHELNNISASGIEATDLIVTIGQAAAAYSQQTFSRNRQLYSFIDFTALPAKHSQNWAAVVLDQPLQRMFDITQTILEARFRNTVVIAVSENNHRLRQEIEQLKVPSQLDLKVLVVNEQAEPAKQVEKLLFNAGALIAIRDKHIWSGENARWMLYQSYKFNVPVIGYSKNFLKAGALVSVYASLPETAVKTARLIDDWHANQGSFSRPGIHYPDFTIEFNKNIARALKIPIPVTLPEGMENNVRD